MEPGVRNAEKARTWQREMGRQKKAAVLDAGFEQGAPRAAGRLGIGAEM